MPTASCCPFFSWFVSNCPCLCLSLIEKSLFLTFTFFFRLWAESQDSHSTEWVGGRFYDSRGRRITRLALDTYPSILQRKKAHPHMDIEGRYNITKKSLSYSLYLYVITTDMMDEGRNIKLSQSHPSYSLSLIIAKEKMEKRWGRWESNNKKGRKLVYIDTTQWFFQKKNVKIKRH